MPLTPENIETLWEKVKQFPVLFGNTLDDKRGFYSYFLAYGSKGEPVPTGIFFVIDDFIGVYYMSRIKAGIDALVHYTFFDRRHRGRVQLTRAMLKYVFEKFGFVRLSTEIPMYTSQHRNLKDNKFINAFEFIKQLNFVQEGRKRKCTFYNNEWFDLKEFGLLREEFFSPRIEPTLPDKPKMTPLVEVANDGN